MAPMENSSGHQHKCGYEPSDTETELRERPRRRSGYEPSDTEAECHESPLKDAALATSYRARVPKDHVGGRRRSMSPYAHRRESLDDNASGKSSALKVAEQRRRTSPYKSRRASPKIRFSTDSFSGSSIKDRVARNRSASTPKLRMRDKTASNMVPDIKGDNASPEDCSSRGEINEMIANGKWPGPALQDAFEFTSMDSIAAGDIFFSRDCTAPLEKASLKSSNVKKTVTEKPNARRGDDDAIPQTPRVVVSMSTVLSKSASRQSRKSTGITSIDRLSSGRFSGHSGKFSDFTGKLVGGVMKFTSNKQKTKNDAWLPCMTGKSCRKSQSPDCKVIDESRLIKKSVVVERIRLFWADKYRPRTLDGFICHRKQVQQLKQLVSPDVCPHIIFKGPPGSGKRSLCRAVLVEIFGDSSLKVSHYLKRCDIQQAPSSMPILVPLASSPHHVELDMGSESKNARYALMALAKEIADKHKATDPAGRKKFKVIVLYNVDKVSENNQHLIKWMIDCYSDACKIIICCEEESNLLDSIKSRCKLISVDAPVSCEIVDVLTHIAKKENFDLPGSFAAAIAKQSRQNLREAILALEACKANKYPFADGQAIPVGWEDVLEEVAAEILADPSPKRLFLVRGKLQKLLVEFVHPRLILLKLVEQFLKGIDPSIKREVYYWHAYYDKRLPTGASALLKLEEFIAKFMSIHRRNLSLHQHS